MITSDAGAAGATMLEHLIFVTLTVVAVFGVIAWKSTSRRLRDAEHRLADIVEGLPEGVVLWDADDRLVAWSTSLVETYKGTGRELRSGIRFEDLIRRGIVLGDYPGSAGREADFLAEMVARHQATGTTECSISGGRTIRIRERRTLSGGIIGTRSEVTDLKRAVATAQHLADHDPLTGLPNRRRFLDQLGAALAHYEDDVAVLYVDLDGFKSVNDTFGHAAGDELLVAVSGRLAATISPGSTVARLGGDEFAILVVGSPVQDLAREVAAQVVVALSQPFGLMAGSADIGASVGFATAGGVDAGHLLDRADEALYRVKRSGGRDVRAWDVEMREAA